MRYSIYGHFELDVVREGGNWKVFNVAAGKRVLRNDVIIPAEVQADEIATYLDDLFHELARPGQAISRLG